MFEPSRVEERVAAGLEAQAADLAVRWRQASLDGSDAGAPGTAQRSDREVERDPLAGGAAGTGDGEPARQLVAALVAGMRHAPHWHDEVMRAGWSFGRQAHGVGVPLHFLLEEVDLLAGMLLQEAERLLAVEAADVASAFRVSRRLLDGMSLLRLSAAKGYTQAVVDELRQRLREIRHGLRNPLGTIKSALALMDDETVPEETRHSGRFRVMAERNADSLETMIASALGDQAGLLPALAAQPVSLHTVACAVRRDLKPEAEERGVALVIGDGLPSARIDAAGFELVLRSTLLALLRAVEAPCEIVVEAETLSARSATVAVSVVPASAAGRGLGAEALAFARELASLTGGQLWVASDGRVRLETPVSARVGEETKDVARPREGSHVEAGTL